MKYTLPFEEKMLNEAQDVKLPPPYLITCMSEIVNAYDEIFNMFLLL